MNKFEPFDLASNASVNFIDGILQLHKGRIMPEFREFPKIARLNREVVVTEKIDGTNACLVISDDGKELFTQSRSKMITPEDDNHGFARWAAENRKELLMLGPGHHYGEWWGAGIQRKYGLKEKRFSLFNAGRWVKTPEEIVDNDKQIVCPPCCYVVPIITRGIGFQCVYDAVDMLRLRGSFAAPGFMNPEGVIGFHTHGNLMFKMTLEKDQDHKWQSK